MHACIHTYIHTYIHRGHRACIHTHTYIHTCMHAYIHTYIEDIEHAYTYLQTLPLAAFSNAGNTYIHKYTHTYQKYNIHRILEFLNKTSLLQVLLIRETHWCIWGSPYLDAVRGRFLPNKP